MADTKTLAIVLRIKDEASSVINRTFKNLENNTERIRKIGKKLSFALTTPLVGFGTLGLKESMKFEQALANVGTLLGKTASEMDVLRNGIIKLMKEVPKSPEDLGATAYDIVSAGFVEMSDALRVLRESSRLAVAGLGSTKEAADLMTSALNAFGKTAQDANKVADVIFKTIKAGKTTVSELAMSFGMVAPIAAQLGVSLENLQAATSALTTTGLSASVAQTQIRSALMSLIKPSKQMQELFQRIGVKDGLELIKTSKNLVDVFERLKKASGDNVEVLAEAIGRVEGLNAVMALTSEQKQAFLDTFKAMTEGVDTLSKGFESATKTTLTQWRLFLNNIKAIVFTIAKDILPTLNDFLKNRVIPALDNFLNIWNKLSPSVRNFIIVITGLIAVLGPLLMLISFIARPLGMLFRGFGLLFGIISRLIPILVSLGGILSRIPLFIAGPVGAIIGFISLIIIFRKQIIEWTNILIQNLSLIRDFWLQKWNEIKEFLFGVIDAISQKITNFLAPLESLFNIVFQQVRNTFIKYWTSIRDFIFGIVDSISSKIMSVFDVITNRISSIINSISNLRRSISEAAIEGLRRFSKIRIPFLGSRQKGGFIERTGLYLLHKGEFVVPAQQKTFTTSKSFINNNFNININNPQIRGEEDLIKLKNMIIRELSRIQELTRLGVIT